MSQAQADSPRRGAEHPSHPYQPPAVRYAVAATTIDTPGGTCPGYNQPLLEFLGLNRHPFLITPDPRAPYCGRSIHDCYRGLGGPLATEHGATFLIGEPGTGKTLLLQCLRNDYRHGVLQWPLRWCVCGPTLDTRDLLRLAEVEPFTRSTDAFGCQTHALLLVDEADHLERRELEKLLRITAGGLRVVLAGSPVLASRARQLGTQRRAPAIRTLSLHPLEQPEVASYIAWRLDAVGCDRSLFSAAAVELIAMHSGGVPRLINRLCAVAMLAAVLERSPEILAEHVKQAADDDALLSGARRPPNSSTTSTGLPQPSTYPPAPSAPRGTTAIGSPLPPGCWSQRCLCRWGSSWCRTLPTERQAAWLPQPCRLPIEGPQQRQPSRRLRIGSGRPRIRRSKRKSSLRRAHRRPQHRRR